MTRWQWPDGKRAAVVFNVAYEAWDSGVAPGLSPMGNPLPPGIADTQAMEWASYAWRSGIWRLLDCYARYGIAATVFTSGRLAEIAPDTVTALAQAGHDVCGHSYAQNILPAALAEPDERADIARCKALLEPLLGGPLQGWVSPRGTPSPQTRRLLAESGFTWHGDCFDRDMPYVERVGQQRIVAMPLAMEINDLPIYARHGNQPRAFVDTFSDVFQAALHDPSAGHVDVTVHAHVFGRPFGVHLLEEIIRTVTSREDVWIGTKSALASWALAAESTDPSASEVGRDD